jgi:two-component system CheB/CheR fusion protein
MLGEMAVRLLNVRTFEETIQTILDDVIAFHGAQFGNVQLPVGDHLVIAAQRGFDREFLQTFQRVKKDDGCACGRALQLGQPIVIADVEKDLGYAPYRDAAKSAGYRSVQSTPFVTQDGKFVAIVSVHFEAPGGPTRSEGGSFNLYTNVAAEQVYELLGGVALAAKAAQMSDELYSSFG